MSFTATIAATSYTVLEGSFKFGDKVDDRSKCSFSVLDKTGTANFTKYQPVVITDTNLSTIFTGIISDPQMNQRYWPSVQRSWVIQCTDQTYRLDKRSSNKVYANQYAGTIAADQIQRYAAVEHVSAPFGLGWYEAFTEWQAGTMSGTTATTNAFDANPGDGDVELSLAGSQVNTTGAAGSKPLVNALYVTGYSNQTGNNAVTNSISFTIWTGSQSIANVLDFFEYEIWVRSDSPAIVGAVDFTCSDGTTFRTSGATDAIGVSCAPKTDLSGLANDQWYGRQFFMPAGLVGKTISQVNVVVETTANGQFNLWFQSIDYNVHNGGVTTFFGTGSTLAAGTTVASSNFTNVAVSTVQAAQFTSDVITHSSVSISAASIVQSSQISWSQVVPTGCTIVTETSIDNQASWQVATSGGAIPNLLAGMSVGSRVVYYRHTLTLGKDPTAAVSLVANAPLIIVNPAYAAIKSDAIASYTSQSDFNTGTATSTAWSPNGLGWTLNGFQQIWAYNPQIMVSNQTTFGTGTVAMKNRILTLSVTNSEVRSRLDFVGTWANFIAEVDATIGPDANSKASVVYRTTGWQNNDATYAYAVELSTTSVSIQRGTNSSSGAGSRTQIATAAVSLAANSTHRLKLVISGSSHIIYVDGIQKISQTDATYTAAGNLALRQTSTNAGANTALFENFGICAALTGTWQSPSISISGPGTYGNSAIMWDIDQIPNTTLISVQTSIDSGSTWQNVTNGGAISGLTAGQSLAAKTLLLKVTFTAQNAPVVPTLNGISAWVVGSYSSSGTWNTGPLVVDTFTKANLAGSWGNSTDNQPWARAGGTDTPSVSSNKGVMTSNGSSSATRMLVGSNTATDCEGLVRVTVGSTGDTTGVILRSDSSSNNHYVARTNGTTQVLIAKRVAGTATTIATFSTGITIANGNLIWIKFRAQGTTLSTKVWLDGITEPANFAGSTTDSTFASGQYGLYCGAAPTTPESFDSFRVTRYPDPRLLLTNAGRATNSLVNWNALTPAGTSLAVSTSTDNGVTYQAIGSAGGAIPGITTLLFSTLLLQKGANLLRYYHLNDSGSSAVDVGSQAQNGTLHGGVTTGVTGLLQGPGETTDKAMSFNGSTGYISMSPSNLPTGSAAWTIVALVSMPSVPASGAQVVAAFGGNTAGTEAGVLCFNQHWLVGNGTSNLTASGTVSANTPYLLIGGYDGTKFFLYVNAVSQGTLTASTNTGSAFASIGADTTTPADWFPGTIGEVAFLNVALQQADVTALYNAAFAGVGQLYNDSFAVNTSASYINSAGAGGSTATWTWDTSHSRISAAGGSKALLLYSALQAADIDLLADFFQSENGGVIWGSQNGSNYYELVVKDASAVSGANTYTLNKMSGGTLTQLATGAITFPATTHHFVHVTMLSGVITAFFDGAQILTYTDSSPFPAGLAGLRNDTGTSYCYELRIQPLFADVSSKNVCTKLALSTTSPTATPQVLDLETFASAATFQTGTLIPSANYNTDQSYISSDIEDLKNQSNFWWYVGLVADSNGNYPVTFTSRTAVPAPWPLDENNSQLIGGQQIGDILITNISVANSASLYRNRQKLKNAIATATFTQPFVGNGQTRTWNVANPLVTPPTVTLNGQAVTLGVQGVDSGKQFYYQIGSTSLTQDNSGTLLQASDSLVVAYTGSFKQDVTRDNTSFPGTITQSALAAITGDSGIVENVIDVSSQNMTVAAAQTYGDQLLQRFGVIGLTMVFTTLRAGLAPGQQLPVYAPSVNVNDIQFLVTDAQMSEQLSQAVSGGVLYVYQVTIQTGPALGSWVKLLANGLNS